MYKSLIWELYQGRTAHSDKYNYINLRWKLSACLIGLVLWVWERCVLHASGLLMVIPWCNHDSTVVKLCINPYKYFSYEVGSHPGVEETVNSRRKSMKPYRCFCYEVGSHPGVGEWAMRMEKMTMWNLNQKIRMNIKLKVSSSYVSF